MTRLEERLGNLEDAGWETEDGDVPEGGLDEIWADGLDEEPRQRG